MKLFMEELQKKVDELKTLIDEDPLEPIHQWRKQMCQFKETECYLGKKCPFEKMK